MQRKQIWNDQREESLVESFIEIQKTCWVWWKKDSLQFECLLSGELEGGQKRATDPNWSLKDYQIERILVKPCTFWEIGLKGALFAKRRVSFPLALCSLPWGDTQWARCGHHLPKPTACQSMHFCRWFFKIVLPTTLNPQVVGFSPSNVARYRDLCGSIWRLFIACKAMFTFSSASSSM